MKKIFIAVLLLAFTTLFEELKAQEVYKVVEQQPEPVGGLKSFYDYIQANLKYPQEAKDKKIQGRVMVKFVVNEDGSISDVSVDRGIGAGCDEEAIRLVKNSPKWVPGKNKGVNVKVEVIKPITFKLD